MNLDRAGKFRVDSECESVSRMRIEPWFVLSPVQEWYYARTHSDYKKLPPYRADCQRGQDDVMEMIYPQRGLRVFIPKDLGEWYVVLCLKWLIESLPRWCTGISMINFLGTTRYHHQLEVNMAPDDIRFISWMRRGIHYGRVLLSWMGKRIINELMFVGF